MSTATTTPTPTEPSYKDAKAQAKAAKAYAKAQRPFYKKKRIILPAAILAVVAISVAANGGESTGTAVAGQGSKATSTKGGSETKAKTFKVGQTVELEGTQYTVTGASTQSSVGGQFGEKADGIFVVVDLTIENKKNETKTFMESAASFIAKDGTKYSGSDASIYLGDAALILRDMQPDLATKGKLVFDVPPAKVAGGDLVVEDLFGRGEAHINLGLK